MANFLDFFTVKRFETGEQGDEIIVFKKDNATNNLNDEIDFIVEGFAALAKFNPSQAARPYNWKGLKKIYDNNHQTVKDELRALLSVEELQPIGIES